MPAVNSSLIASPLIFKLPTLQQSFLCFKSKTAIRFLLEDLDGLNLIGLKRRGVDRNDITALRAAFQSLAQGDGTFQDRARKLGEETTSEYVDTIVNFILGASDRSFLTPGDF